MDLFFSIVGLVLILVVAFIVARFILRLTARVIGCLMTALVAVGIVAIAWFFFFQ